MIVQSTSIGLKNRNEPSRECLYAWYPEVVQESNENQFKNSRDIYIHKGIDRSLLQDSFYSTQTMDSSMCSDDIYRRYQQSVAQSERIYQSAETIEEALKTPWALHFDVERHAATPNVHSGASIDQESKHDGNHQRRLKSAPVLRTVPVSTVLNVPEPQLKGPIIPPATPLVTGQQQPQQQQQQQQQQPRQRSRASSAKARLNTTYASSGELNQDSSVQTMKSALGLRSGEGNNLIDVQNQRLSTSAFSSKSEQINPTKDSQEARSIVEVKTASNRTNLIHPTSLPANLHHSHRPTVVSANNSDKRSLVRPNSSSKQSYRYSQTEIRQGPLLAIRPVSQTGRSPILVNGVYLIYDPKLTMDEPSTDLKKYFIDGHLYLIKDQRYNVIENIDASYFERLNKTLNLPKRPKYYQTIPLEKLQIPKSTHEIHYKASETFFYNTIPKRPFRYVIDPNFISENLNVNRLSLSERPPSGNGLSSATKHQQTQRSSSHGRTHSASNLS